MESKTVSLKPLSHVLSARTLPPLPRRSKPTESLSLVIALILPLSALISNHAPSLANFAPKNALNTKSSPAPFVTAPLVPVITVNTSKGADWITSSTMLQNPTKSISSICPFQDKV